MPSNSVKGIPNIYDACCDGSFYEFASNATPVVPGLICEAPVWFADQEMYMLKEEQYNSYYEEESTWKISKAATLNDIAQCKHNPYKFLQVESDELLAVIKYKIRPVVPICKLITDWKHPQIPTNAIDYWFCLPIFNYKDRHSQTYVLHDQALDVPHRFYFPSGMPGIEYEGAGKITQIRCIPERYLKSRLCFCKKENKAKPIRLGKNALNAVTGHIAVLLPEIQIAGVPKDYYEFFKELAKDEVHKLAKAYKILTF
ncbi:MAG: hypothetical protein EG825_10690 [Rhodocyclaceae bacterium]|nr:hypothetical protein [Rhodocyclaceae bacterium]